MSGLLDGVSGAVLAPGEGARAAGPLLAALGAAIVDDPASADFCIVDASADVDGLRAGRPALVVLVVREDGSGSPAITALEAVSAVVTGLRHAARTLSGQQIDLDAREAALAAAGESLMIAQAGGGTAS